MCDFCAEKFHSSNISKHLKQRHSTYSSSRTNDSSYKKNLLIVGQLIVLVIVLRQTIVLMTAG